jgi:hypothetical protein
MTSLEKGHSLDADPAGRWLTPPRPTAMPIVTAGQQPLFADDLTAFDALSRTNLDLRRIVYLPPNAHRVISSGPQPSSRVRLTEFANQRISLQTASPAPAMLVIAQSYYPGWKAYVDGRPTRIWRANYAFQALEVAGGEHPVQLLSEDRTFRAGALLSCLGLIACAGLGVTGPAKIRPGGR